ncbi:DUF6056 family protein [Phycisphaeraceae bacterium D3-23]
MQTTPTESNGDGASVAWRLGGRLPGLLLLGAMLIAVGVFFALSFYAHPQTDDFCEATDVREMGVVATIQYRYATWTGRYFYILVEANTVNHLDLTTRFWVVGVVTLSLVWLAVFAFVSSITRGTLPRLQTAGLSLALMALYLVLLPKPAHAFYWLTGAATNQLALVTLLFAFALLLRDPAKQGRAKRIASMVVAALCVAASVGSYDTTMLMLLGLLMVGSVIALIARDARRLPWLVALGAGLASAAVVLAAPGNGVREELFEKASVWQAIDYSITNSLKWLVPYLLSPAVLVASLLFVPMGWALSRPLRAMAGGRPGWMLGFIPLWGLMIVCAWLPAQYMMQGNPPPRTLNPVSMFVLVGVFASIVIVLAQREALPGKSLALPRGLVSAAQVALALVLMTQGNANTALLQLKGEAGAYDRAMRQRYATIREAKARGLTQVTVPPSPALPTMLIHKELTADPDAYPNWAAARYWDLTWIALEPEEARVVSAAPGFED